MKLDHIIFSSYGNDSVALIQWAIENKITNNISKNIDILKFDTRSLKKIQDILSLPANDRSDLYRMLNKMLRKNQLEIEKIKQHQE